MPPNRRHPWRDEMRPGALLAMLVIAGLFWAAIAWGQS